MTFYVATLASLVIPAKAGISFSKSNKGDSGSGAGMTSQLCAMLSLFVQEVHAAEESAHVRLERIARNAATFNFFVVRLEHDAA